MKKAITLLLCLCMVLTLFTACGKKAADNKDPENTQTPNNVTSIEAGGQSGSNEIIQADNYKDVFRIGGQIEFTSLDIHETQNAYYLVLLTHDTLITERNGEFEPALATEWKQLDDTHYEFKLREGVTFHDGSKFTAEDVVFTMERGMASPTAALPSKLSCVEKVEATDEYTVLFTLNTPNQDFMISLAGGYASILSKTALEKDPEGYKYGTGPWITTNFVPSISATMERNENFWGELPKAKVMEYKLIVEDPARLVALRADEVDVCCAVAAADNDGLVADPDLKAIQIRDGGVSFMAFDERDPLLSDVNLRKAICYCVNPEDVIAVAQEGWAEVSDTIWGTGCFGETDELEGFYYDPELAREYLAKSSYNGEPLSIMCGVKLFVDNANVVAGFMNEIGIETVIDERDFVGLLSGGAYDSEPHQVVSFGSTWSNLPDHCRNYLYEGKRNNYTCVAHPEIQALMDQALVEQDTEVRKELYRQIQQYIIDNALYLPMYRRIYFCAEGKNVGGVVWTSDVYAYNFRNGCVAITD